MEVPRRWFELPGSQLGLSRTSASDAALGRWKQPASDRDSPLGFTNDDHPDRDVPFEHDDNYIGAVLGGLNFRQIGRDEAGLSECGQWHVQHLNDDLGGKRQAILEDINEDVVGHGTHGGNAGMRAGARPGARA